MSEAGEKAAAARNRRVKKASHHWPVRLDELLFTSDHALITDEPRDRWTQAGTVFAPPDWRRAPARTVPITHTRGQKLEANATLAVHHADAKTRAGVAEAFLGRFRLSLKATRSESFGPGAAKEVPVSSPERLPDAVGRIRPSAQWLVRAGRTDHAAGLSGVHEIFLTYGPPVVGSGAPEDGVTYRRMKHAVTWIGEAWANGRREPADLIAAVFGKFRSYVLSAEMSPRASELLRRADLLARIERAGFPAYLLPGEGGAWPLAQWWSYGGECQAIVRLTAAIAHQIGLPGQVELKYVTNGPGIFDTRILDHGERATGPDPGLRWVLADAPVTVGDEYAFDTYEGVGFNNFEACMKYTDDQGCVSWFAGGIGRLDGFDESTGVLEFFSNGGLVGYRTVRRGHRNVRHVVEYHPYGPEWDRRHH